VVPGAEGLLLYDRRPGLRDYSIARNDAYNSAHTIPHDASDTPAYPTSHAASDEAAAPTATHSSACPRGTSRPLQLRCRTVFLLGRSQAAVVLQFPPHLRPTDATASSS